MNNVSLIGNLAQAPEYTTFASGKRNARVTLVVNNYRPNSEPMYIRCEFWETKAENLEKCNVRKGTQIAVHGPLAPNNWEKKIGETTVAMKTLFVRVDGFDVLTKKGETPVDEPVTEMFDGTSIDSVSLLPESSSRVDDASKLKKLTRAK